MADVPDHVLLPLRDRLQDWTEWDVAGFYLGRAIGILPDHYSFGSAKGMMYGASPGEPGRHIILLLNLLADIGVLEMRNSYTEFRWPYRVS
jgi:hypothetical protein